MIVTNKIPFTLYYTIKCYNDASLSSTIDSLSPYLSGYVIEKRDVTHGGGWVPAVTWVDPKETRATVPRLLEGTQYEFRVKAENMQGPGEPLVSDKPVTAKASAGE